MRPARSPQPTSSCYLLKSRLDRLCGARLLRQVVTREPLRLVSRVGKQLNDGVIPEAHESIDGPY